MCLGFKKKLVYASKCLISNVSVSKNLVSVSKLDEIGLCTSSFFYLPALRDNDPSSNKEIMILGRLQS